MPRPAYNARLSDEDIMQLVRDGKYHVDLEAGLVFSDRTRQEVFTYAGNEEGYLFIRLYDQPKHRTLPVSQVVWIVGTQSTIPKGWEVHHRDGNIKNNSFSNLYCLHPVDHRKLHRDDDLINMQQEPF